MGVCQPANPCFTKEDEAEFFKEKAMTFASKFDKSVFLLKKLKKKAKKYKDTESVADLEWLLDTIMQKDFYEPEYKESEVNGNHNAEKIDFLVNYTNMHRFSTIKHDTDKVNQLIAQKEQEKGRKPIKYAGFINKFKKSVSNIVISLEKKENYAMQALTSDQITGVANVISKIDSFEFNIFDLDYYAAKSSIYFVLNQTFTRCGLLKLIPEHKFVEFCKAISNGYNRKVVYHNDLHGADVCQTSFIQLDKGNLTEKLGLGDIDKIALLTAAASHDYKHNGLNNNFQVMRGTDMALTYNDSTVLENMHVSETFKMLQNQNNNFLELFRPEEYRHIRRRMIDCILATDMARHVQQKSYLKVLIETYDIKKGANISNILVDDTSKKFENQQLILSQVVHTADLSNPAKIKEVFDKWTDLVYEEFFSQGDLERSHNMAISPLCDRKIVKKAKSQVGFIQYVVISQFDLMLEVIPEVSFYKEAILKNLERYKAKQLEEEEEAKV